MKKILLILVLVSIGQQAFSQVGINTTLPNAQLDIKSSNQLTPSNTDGILIPKIDAFPVINPTAAQNSMMVYLTTLSAGKPPGFYYWHSASNSWKGFGSDFGWSTTGNAGTNAATNFMGTTDDNDIVFKRFNTKAGLLGSYVTGFGVQSLNANTSGNGNASFGAYSMWRNTTGSFNVAIGSDAMSRMTEGSNGTSIGYASMFYFGGPSGAFVNSNTAIGYYSMFGEHSGSSPGTNNIGLRNTAVGYEILQGISSGNDNTAMGYQALFTNGRGDDNVALGSRALYNNTAGGKNIAIGKNALFTQNYSNAGAAFDTNNIAIGYEALYLNNPADNFTGTYNVAVGHYAMRGVGTSQGSSNSAFGGYSLYSNQTGGGNVAVGFEALYTNRHGEVNVANGYRALHANTDGSANTAVGAWVLDSNTTGQNNVAVGYGALSGNTTSHANVAVGRNALAISTGGANVGIGFESGNLISSGSSNITIGAGAQVPTPSASNQMSIGNVIYGATMTSAAAGKIGIGIPVPAEKLEVAGKTKTTDLQVTNGAATGRILTSDATGNATWQLPAVLTGWATTGNASTNPSTHFIGTTDNVDFVFKRFSTLSGRIATMNTSLGVNSLLVGPTGTGNNAFGTSALQQAGTAMNNNAVGNYALLNNHTGNYNNAMGYGALNANTTSSNNVAVGNRALYTHGFANGQNLYDANNVAVGFEALFNNNPTSISNGVENTAIGSNSLRSNTTGYQNVAVGYRSLFNNQTGYFNTAVGYNVFPTSGTNLFNYTGIGYNVGGASSTSNSVELGNGSVSFIRAQVTGITAYSDRRIKTNIKSNVPGLEFITKLNPVTYNLDLHKQNAILYRNKEQADTDWEGKYDIEKVTQTGFIAQEVAEAAQAVNYDFNGVAIPKKQEDLYGVNYTSFVVPLVKAVQEQQQIIDSQNKKIELLEKANEAILKRLEKLENK